MSKVIPTKINLIRLKRSLSVAKRVHKILENKREVLLIQLNKLISEAVNLRKEMEEALLNAYESITIAGMRMGPKKLEEIAITVPSTLVFRTGKKSVMGVVIPSIKMLGNMKSSKLSFDEKASALEEAIDNIRKALEMIIRLAEAESSIYRLANELRETQRLINALENIIIPRYESQIKFIESTLEEREREEFVVKKAYKRLIERRWMEWTTGY